MAGNEGPDAQPKDKGRPLPFTQGTGVDLSMCIPEIAEAKEKDCIWTYFQCPYHERLIPVRELGKKHLPEGCQTEEHVLKMKEHAQRTVRVQVKHRSKDRLQHQGSTGNDKELDGKPKGEDSVWGTGFLFPGGFYEDKPCVCKDCVGSENPRVGYHVAYVLTARHVVFDEYEANNVKFDLFYEDWRKRHMRTIRGLGMAGDEECVVVGGRSEIVAVVGARKDGGGGIGSGGSGDGGGKDGGGGVSSGGGGDGIGGDGDGSGIGGDSSGSSKDGDDDGGGDGGGGCDGSEVGYGKEDGGEGVSGSGKDGGGGSDGSGSGKDGGGGDDGISGSDGIGGGSGKDGDGGGDGSEVVAMVEVGCGKDDGGVSGGGKDGGRGDGGGDGRGDDDDGRDGIGGDGRGDDGSGDGMFEAYRLLGLDSDAMESWGVNVRDKMTVLREAIMSFLRENNKTESPSENESRGSFHLGFFLVGFIDLLSKGDCETALYVCSGRFADMVNMDDVRDATLASIRDMADSVGGCLLRELNDECLEQIQMVKDQCHKLMALCRYFLKDMNMYEHVKRLRFLVGKMHVFTSRLIVCFYYVIHGKFNQFINMCDSMCQDLHNTDHSFATNSQQHQSGHYKRSDENMERSRPSFGGKLCLHEDEEEYKMFSSVISRLSDALFNSGKNDSYLFLALLIPLYIDHTDVGSFHFFQDAFKHFWDFVRVNHGFGILSSTCYHTASVLSSFINRLYLKYQINETDTEFLTALHAEMVDSEIFNHRIKKTCLPEKIIRYKTDKVLVKCVTHDPEMINFFKDMLFLPPTLPFAFIISHPHAYYKHFGVGRLIYAPVQGSASLFVVKLGAKSKFKLLKNFNSFPSNVDKFLKLIKFGTESRISITANEEYPLNFELTLAFPETSIDDFRAVGTSCWLRFPSGTVCIYTEQNCESFLLPENLEFYSYYNAEDVLRSLQDRQPMCYTHDVPTCEGSSGSLVNDPSPLVCYHWFTHCASFIRDAKKFGLTSIASTLRKQPYRANELVKIREYLNVTTHVFSGPSQLTHHSSPPFQD